jgi:hypothetical protein
MANIYQPINFLKGVLALALIISGPVFAWSHEISLGYAIPSMESDQVYSHSGVYLNGNFYSYHSVDRSLLFTLNASTGYWTASSEQDNHVMTLAVQPTFRVYFSHQMMHYARPYLLVGYGPAYLSNKKLGTKEQGAHFAFQGDIGGGIELGKNYKGLDISLRMVHFSNADLFTPNQGFDFLYVLSIGVLF